MEVVMFLINNWYVILGMFCVVAVISISVVKFFNMPTATQIASVQEWLRIAVVNAEMEFGSGTGQLKLRSVYEAAVIRFPWIAQFVKFETFSVWVDLALDWMRDQIDTNESIKNYMEC